MQAQQWSHSAQQIFRTFFRWLHSKKQPPYVTMHISLWRHKQLFLIQIFFFVFIFLIFYCSIKKKRLSSIFFSLTCHKTLMHKSNFKTCFFYKFINCFLSNQFFSTRAKMKWCLEFFYGWIRCFIFLFKIIIYTKCWAVLFM